MTRLLSLRLLKCTQNQLLAEVADLWARCGDGQIQGYGALAFRELCNKATALRFPCPLNLGPSCNIWKVLRGMMCKADTAFPPFVAFTLTYCF